MMVRVWEYEVDEDATAEFEVAYGAEGPWARLFASSPEFSGTTLYRAVSPAGRYLTVDLFSSEDGWRRFLVDHSAAYAEVGVRTAHLTLHQTELAAGETPGSSGR